METKHCNCCGKNLPTDMFWKRTYPTGKVATQPKCKSCQSKNRVKYYKPHHLIRDMLKISDDHYEELMENKHCNICGTELQKKCIDHCHTTKKIRGVLCNNCNTALGLFKDNPEIIRNAIQYLEQ